MIDLRSGTKIWLAAGVTDMRRGFDGPVSYTHLDVYKRQIMGSIDRAGCVN